MPESFIYFWQHLPEKIDPVIFRIGPLKVQYYGLMYILAFGLTYMLVLWRLKREDRFRISREHLQDLTLHMMIGLILGARIGYVLFYNFAYYMSHPLEIFLPFTFSDGIRFSGISGMSYHGGLIGTIAAAFIYTKKANISLLETADLFVPVIPLGYTFGRIGNFINKELYGRITDLPIGMYFPTAPGPYLRHPSQLYEAFFEGIVTFAILFSLRKNTNPKGSMLCLYLICYGTFRFFIEFVRQPDEQLGLILFSLSMGQLLCILMILSGFVLFFLLKSLEKKKAGG